MILNYFLLAILLFASEAIYFSIAKRLGIVDFPNQRSSHANTTIRGGGIIFVIALFFWFSSNAFKCPWLILGALIVAGISFIDDVKTVPPVVRTVFQFFSVVLLFYQTSLFDWPLWLIVVAIIVCIGTLNAFNFMDGINGITGSYALVNFVSFAYVNRYLYSFSDETLLGSCMVAVVVFLYFNFRANAKCFAGDVGSITLCFIQIYFLLALIQTTSNFYWVVLFLVFGLDSVITIIHRLLTRENIFMAHRQHLYQYLSNELGIPHTWVSTGYGITQLAINAFLIFFVKNGWYHGILVMGILISLGFILLRHFVQRQVRIKLNVVTDNNIKQE